MEENIKNKLKLFQFVIPILFIFILLSCNVRQKTQEESGTEFVIPDEKPERYNLTLLAAGDNLFHEPIIRTHRQNGTYNFAPIYSEIKAIIQKADIAFINQETVMAGTEFGYSGYPAFNTPQPLARTLADTGFSIVNLANNHAMDMGREGLHNTLDLFDTIDEITVIGARKTGESHFIITMNNITLGFLSYTYGLNGFTLPPAEPNLVSLINRNKMSEEINALRPLCDFLIVSMHWGQEYLLEPDSFQRSIALFLAEHNVDLIIGHHPHVLQPVVFLDRPDGKRTLCFYSLGNLVSNQREKERILGALMLVTFTKEGERLFISNSGILPVVCHFERYFTNTKVYPLYSYSQELLDKHYLKILDRDIDFDFFNSILFNMRTKLVMDSFFLKGVW